jgi:hypothetical protein
LPDVAADIGWLAADLLLDLAITRCGNRKTQNRTQSESATPVIFREKWRDFFSSICRSLFAAHVIGKGDPA